MHEIGERYVLPPHDGFDLTVHLEADGECNAHDFQRHFTKADLASWNHSWRFVGIMVEASRNGRELGHSVAWMEPHGIMGIGKPRDALGRSGAFSGHVRERLISQAILAAVNAIRHRTLADLSYDQVWDMYSSPAIERTTGSADRRYPWRVIWPDRQITTYRSRTAAQEAVYATVLELWIEGASD